MVLITPNLREIKQLIETTMIDHLGVMIITHLNQLIVILEDTKYGETPHAPFSIF
jgi:hypothetical protein